MGYSLPSSRSVQKKETCLTPPKRDPNDNSMPSGPVVRWDRLWGHLQDGE